MRVEDGRYRAFLSEVEGMLPRARVCTDPLRRLAYGGDASFYRLLPKAVIKVHSEEEMAGILPLAAKHQVPVTFRAAGTSLSGQAITDSVLLKISHVGRHFRRLQILDGGARVSVDVGLLGGEVNKLLALHAVKQRSPTLYRLGPDPASIDSAMIGGIVANNASGMCCGVAQNTYHTLGDMRLVLLDGTVLDTSDPASCKAFQRTHAELCRGVSELAARVQADESLSDLIRRKYRMKNTVGLSLNALVDFPPGDPIAIIKHLMVGSEGTLGFVSNVTYNTVPEWPFKASAFVLFPDIRQACQAVLAMKRTSAASAVELCDWASLKLASAEMHDLVANLGTAQDGAAALLIEVKGPTEAELQQRIDQVRGAMRDSGVEFGGRSGVGVTLEAFPFRLNPKEAKVFWDFRKGLVPLLGGSRSVGTQFCIEDVVCPVENLADMTLELIDLFHGHGYSGFSAVGHALEGNLHLVFSQGFRTEEEVATFGSLLEGMARIVLRHGGSLKGEHGTGRNMAPFVEMEWGRAAVDIMRQVKVLFDPVNLLNPGVILNEDPNCHMHFLKPSQPSSSIVDHCMECGYCEAVCPSRDVTITPRQRIQVYREITRLRGLRQRSAEQEERLGTLVRDYAYQGDATCAADGMCAVRCPVDINTGDLIKSLRVQAVEEGVTEYAAAPVSGPTAGARLATWLARHFGLVTTVTPPLLNVVDLAARVVGPGVMRSVSGALNRWSGRVIPVWTPFTPKGAPPLEVPPALAQPSAARGAGAADASLAASATAGVERKVVFFPSCVTRMMGPSHSDPVQAGVHNTLLTLARRAGYEVVLPQGLPRLCCGMMFDSRGTHRAKAEVSAELQRALMAATNNGVLPVVTDTSPCLAQLKSDLPKSLNLSLYEPVGFINTFLKPHLEFSKVKDVVSVHVPCTSKQAGLEEAFTQLTALCASEVVPTGIPCCGQAGDRGMRYPELAAAATQHLDLPPGCRDGYSTARTCELNVSNAAGFDFRSIVFLVEEATRAAAGEGAAPAREPLQQRASGPGLQSAPAARE